jgi:hypothetical protein
MIAAIELLQEIEAKEGLPRKEVTTYSFQKEGAYEASNEIEVDFSLFIFRHSKEISELPKFLECAKYVATNPVTRRQLGWVDSEGRQLKEIPLTLDYFRSLYSLLQDYLIKASKLYFAASLFDELYAEFERHYYVSLLPYKVAAPVHGLFGTMEEVELGNNLRLHRLSESEKTTYIRLIEPPSSANLGFAAFDVSLWQYAIEKVHYHRKGTAMDTSSSEKECEDVITTLRLFKSGRIDIPVFKIQSAIWQPHHMISFHPFSHASRLLPFRTFEFNESEKSGLLRLWKRMRIFKQEVGSYRSGKYINIALKRFNSGIEEDDFEDKIIDFLIAFEALYLLERDELTYKLSNRVAILLGKTDADADETRKLMAKAYDLRSGIIHGKEVRPIKIEGKIIERGDFLKRVEEYLRRSLRWFITFARTYKNQDSILKTLDLSLINTRTRRLLRRTRMCIS